MGAVSTFKIDLPSLIGEISESVGAPIKKVLYSLDCMLAGMSFVPIEYMRLIWAIIIPAFYALILVGIYYYTTKKQGKKMERHVFISGAVFLYLYYQPNIVIIN